MAKGALGVKSAPECTLGISRSISGSFIIINSQGLLFPPVDPLIPASNSSFKISSDIASFLY
jgi:hypothetical protein